MYRVRFVGGQEAGRTINVDRLWPDLCVPERRPEDLRFTAATPREVPCFTIIRYNYSRKNAAGEFLYVVEGYDAAAEKAAKRERVLGLRAGRLRRAIETEASARRFIAAINRDREFVESVGHDVERLEAGVESFLGRMWANAKRFVRGS